MLANPLTQTVVLDLRSRRLDLLADGTVSRAPEAAALADSEQITVAVTLLTGSLLPPAARPRVAVAG